MSAAAAIRRTATNAPPPTHSHLARSFGLRAFARSSIEVNSTARAWVGTGTGRDPDMVPLDEVINRISALFASDHPDSPVRDVVTHIKE